MNMREDNSISFFKTIMGHLGFGDFDITLDHLADKPYSYRLFLAKEFEIRNLRTVDDTQEVADIIKEGILRSPYVTQMVDTAKRDAETKLKEVEKELNEAKEELSDIKKKQH